jgi:hypothetical protein
MQDTFIWQRNRPIKEVMESLSKTVPQYDTHLMQCDEEEWWYAGQDSGGMPPRRLGPHRAMSVSYPRTAPHSGRPHDIHEGHHPGSSP